MKPGILHLMKKFWQLYPIMQDMFFQELLLLQPSYH